MNPSTTATNVDEYIQRFPASVQTKLLQLRKTIRAAAPKAEEVISYQMPAYKQNGMLVFFAAYEKHIGFYPTGTGIKAFTKEIAGYKNSKGAVQFPIDKPLPLRLVSKMVKFKLKENQDKEQLKKKLPAKPIKKKGLTENELVEGWIKELNPVVKKEINALRAIIKKASPKLTERIKWNAPSYYYKADILTFGPYKTQGLMLVFHHPLIVNIKSDLLEGAYKDRRLVRFQTIAVALKQQKELTRVIRQMIQLIENSST